MKQYTVLVYEDPEDPGKWLAEFPAVHGAHSWGYSPEEAVRNATEALELVIEVLKEDGKPLPEDIETRKVEVNAA
jgi:predicted RNase H-like HicB family nuclease